MNGPGVPIHDLLARVMNLYAFGQIVEIDACLRQVGRTPILGCTCWAARIFAPRNALVAFRDHLVLGACRAAPSRIRRRVVSDALDGRVAERAQPALLLDRRLMLDI